MRDKNGKIIPGLTAKDFTLTEDNTPQTIQFVDFETLPTEPAAQFATRPDAAPAADKTATDKPADAKKPDTPKVASVTGSQIADGAAGVVRYKK